MKFLSSVIAAGLAGTQLVSAAPLESGLKDKRSFVERDGTNYTVFEHAATGAKLEFVTNSGICETTAGVNQYSGYLSVGTNMNMCKWKRLALLCPYFDELMRRQGSGSSSLATAQPPLLLLPGSMAVRAAAP